MSQISNLLRDFGVTTPEASQALAKSMRDAATGEYGFIDGFGNKIQKDATNQVGVALPLGLLGVPLEVPAKLLYSVPTPLRNRLPRETIGGASVTFRKITAINSTNVWGSVAEASDSTSGRNSRIAFNEANIVYTFKTIEQESMLTPEALFGSNSQLTPGQDFQAEDIARLTLLHATMIAEERMLLGGNIAALGNVVGITKTAITQLTTAIAGSSLVALTAYNVQVTALTLQGFIQNSLGGDAAGIFGETTAAAATVLTTAAAASAGDTSLAITWTAVPGAVAYNVYLLTGAAAKFQQRVFVNYAQILSTGTGAVVNVTDKSPNALDYDGLVAQCCKTAFIPGYYLALPVVAAGAATLTSDGAAGVNEIDLAFKTFYDTYKIGPDEVWVNTSQKKKVDQIVAGSSAPVLRIDAAAGDLNIKGSIGVRSIMNRYMGKETPVTVHPFLPAGTILFVSYGLGPFYAASNVGDNIKVFLGWDYRSITFGLTKRAVEMGMDLNGALVVHANFALGAIQNVA